MQQHTFYLGNTLDCLRTLPDESVQCCVTSPPYWSLRDYGVAPTEWPELDYSPLAGLPPIVHIPAWSGCLGLEPTLEMYVGHLVEVFREVRRVLRGDGVMFLNLGDSYTSGGRKTRDPGQSKIHPALENWDKGRPNTPDGLKPKDLVGIPWRVAFALQADGWWLRSDIIWAKRNCIPESVTDRPTKSHEYIFLLSKRERYYYDSVAIQEPQVCPQDSTPEDLARAHNRRRQAQVDPRQDLIRPSALAKSTFRREHAKYSEPNPGQSMAMFRPDRADTYPTGFRNKRDVWAVATQPFKGAHFLADYVGSDGKPYIASPNCPIHGHLADPEKWHRLGYDVRQDSPSNHTECSENRPAQVLGGDLSAKTHRSMQDSRQPTMDCPNPESVPRHTPQSTAECRIPGDHCELNEDGKTSSHTNRTEEQHALMLGSLDSPDPEREQTATSRSTRNRRTGLVLETSPPCTSSAQMSCRTDGKPTEPENDGMQQRIVSSSTVGGSAEGGPGFDPSAQMTDRKSDRYTPLVSPSQEEHRCTCAVSQIDHFAVFPEALVEPCILAGTSEIGCCPKCGAPWIRITAKETRFEGNSAKAGRTAEDLLASGKWQGNNRGEHIKMGPVVSSETKGWRPSCSCGLSPIPCDVLDPFGGSGTVSYVAQRLGRSSIYVDLKPEYRQMAVERMRPEQPSLVQPFEIVLKEVAG